jgi:hypothetical protein
MIKATGGKTIAVLFQRGRHHPGTDRSPRKKLIEASRFAASDEPGI